MTNDKVIKKVLGSGTPSSNKMFKDSDGDGVMNVYDCKPYNKNKQGIIHDAKKAIKDSLAKRRERKEEERKAFVTEKEAEKAAFVTARREERIETAKARGRQQARRESTPVFQRTIQSLGAGFSVGIGGERVVRTSKLVKVKGKKKKVRRKVTVRAKPVGLQTVTNSVPNLRL